MTSRVDGGLRVGVGFEVGADGVGEGGFAFACMFCGWPVLEILIT